MRCLFERVVYFKKSRNCFLYLCCASLSVCFRLSSMHLVAQITVKRASTECSVMRMQPRYSLKSSLQSFYRTGNAAECITCIQHKGVDVPGIIYILEEKCCQVSCCAGRWHCYQERRYVKNAHANRLNGLILSQKHPSEFL